MPVTDCDLDKEAANSGGSHASAVTAGHRFRACLLYIGVAPACWGRAADKSSNYLATHYRQAMTLWAFFGVVLAAFAALILALSFLMVYRRGWDGAENAETWLLLFARRSLLIWFVFWLYSLWRCVRGVAQPVPFLGRLARPACMRWTGVVFIHLFFIAGTVLPFFAWHADRLVAEDPSRGGLFMLYDDLGWVPRPVYSMAAYPTVRRAVRQWGRGGAVLLPLNRENIQTALDGGRLVFIGSHGTARGLLLTDGYYQPDDVPPRPSVSPLRYVYLAGCDSGVQQAAWEQAFFPAEVKTYARITPTVEHLWWLWTQGPGMVDAVAQ